MVPDVGHAGAGGALWGLTALLRAQAASPGNAAIQAGQMIRRPFFALLYGGIALLLPFCLRPVRFLFGNRVMKFWRGFP